MGELYKKLGSYFRLFDDSSASVNVLHVFTDATYLRNT